MAPNRHSKNLGGRGSRRRGKTKSIDEEDFSLTLCLSECHILGPEEASIEEAKAILKNATFNLEIELAFDLEATLLRSAILPAPAEIEKTEGYSNWIADFKWQIQLTLWDDIPTENVEFDPIDTCQHINVDLELPDGWEMISWTQGNG